MRKSTQLGATIGIVLALVLIHAVQVARAPEARAIQLDNFVEGDLITEGWANFVMDSVGGLQPCIGVGLTATSTICGASVSLFPNGITVATSSGSLGVGTSTSASILGITGNIVQGGGAAELQSIRATNIIATSSTALSGFGTSTPGANLSVRGNFLLAGGALEILGGIRAANIIATSTTLASGFGTSSPASLLGITGNIVQGGGAAELISVRSGTIIATSTLFAPASANPTISTLGQIAIDTTAASTSERFHDGTAERALYDTQDKAVVIASSTAYYLGNFGHGSGTTTIRLWNPNRPVTITAAYCQTDTGTADVNFHDGTNRTPTIQATANGGRQGAVWNNNSWIMRESVRIDIGNSASSPNTITCTVTVREDAD